MPERSVDRQPLRAPIARPATARYAVAVLSIAIAFFLRWLLDPLLGENFPFLLVYGAVAVAVWFGGWAPASLAAIVGFLLADYFFIATRNKLDLGRPEVWTGFIGYALSCGAIVLLGEAMRRAQQRAEQQKELLSVTLTSMGDAVIVTDDKGHITSLNGEAERLTGWTKEEAWGHPLAEVFAVINEHTREATENPFEKVLRLGTITGLANHTILISKDGREVPIGDSAAPIRHEGGPILGVVLVFRDVTEQRRAQRDRARLGEIVKYSGDAIFTKDLNGIITSWNESAKRLFGYEADEIVGKPVTVMFPPERLGEEDYILGRLRRGQPCERLETIRVAKNGRHINVLLSISPLKDPDGEIIGASKIVHDITDLVAAREALMREKELLATTLASIGDGVILTDERGRITFLNSQAERLTGWTSEDARGLALNEVFKIVNEDTRVTVENPVDKVLRLGGVVGLANHTILITKDGREIPIDDSAAPIRRPGGPLFGIVLVFRDFTLRKKVEADLREREQRLSQQARLLDLSRDAMILRDPDDRVLFWNEGAEKMYGFTRDEAMGKLTHDLLGTEHPTMLAEIVALLRRDGYWEGELVHKRHDGSRLTVLSRWALDRDEQGNPTSILETNVDISERKRIERHREELLASEQDLRHEAEEANRLKDEFLAIMSHELRNPLNVIVGYSELLARTDEVTRSEHLQHMAEAIRRNALVQARLIRDLLDLSRLRSGKLELNKETMPIISAVNNAIETVRVQAESKQITIEIKTPDEPLFVNADPVRIEQMVWNLLNNAVKFTPGGGRISVELGANDGRAVLSVTDTGEGIDPSFLPHIFELFRQADASTSRMQTGMGIGLAVVQQLVDLHHGSVTASSPGLGKGAAFTVELPLSPESISSPRKAGDVNTSLQGLEILVVDDSLDTAEMLAQMLKISGAIVTAATGGAEALRLASENDFDVIISDISMPHMDGFDFLRRLRELPGQADVPAIALTGFGRPEDVERARSAGFRSHITKPFDFDDLVSVLNELPKKRKSSAS